MVAMWATTQDDESEMLLSEYKQAQLHLCTANFVAESAFFRYHVRGVSRRKKWDCIPITRCWAVEPQELGPLHSRRPSLCAASFSKRQKALLPHWKLQREVELRTEALGASGYCRVTHEGTTETSAYVPP